MHKESGDLPVASNECYESMAGDRFTSVMYRAAAFFCGRDCLGLRQAYPARSQPDHLPHIRRYRRARLDPR